MFKLKKAYLFEKVSLCFGNKIMDVPTLAHLMASDDDVRY
jgi:hypothetical protein